MIGVRMMMGAAGRRGTALLRPEMQYAPAIGNTATAAEQSAQPTLWSALVFGYAPWYSRAAPVRGAGELSRIDTTTLADREYGPAEVYNDDYRVSTVGFSGASNNVTAAVYFDDYAREDAGAWLSNVTQISQWGNGGFQLGAGGNNYRWNLPDNGAPIDTPVTGGTHLAIGVVRDGISEFWLDGELIGSRDASGFTAAATDFVIGSYYDLTPNFRRLKHDHYWSCGWDRALLASEIRSIAEYPFAMWHKR